MYTKQVFKKYYKRLATEGIIKALLCGSIIGFACAFVAAAAFWMTASKMFWLSAVLLVAVTAATTPLFYFKKFRPTTKSIAKRVDVLGLEERLLTMTELEGDTSFIAMKQREDALAAVEKVSEQFIKIAVSTSLIVTCAVVAFFGIGMTTVSALSANGVIKSGQEVITDITTPEPKVFEIRYEVKDDIGGLIEGDMKQEIREGEDTEAVMAIADDGFVFVGWSDGETDPYRIDFAVKESMTVYALFQEIEDAEDGEPNGDGQGDGDAPAEAGEGQPGANGGEPAPGQGDGEGGSSNTNNNINNGETPYGDNYGQDSTGGMDSVGNNPDAGSGDKGFLGGYYGGLNPGN